MIWVDIFKAGADLHKGGRVITYTPQFLGAIVRNFEALRADGYRVPILLQHEHDGRQYGTVEALAIRDGYMQARVHLLDPELREAFNLGMLGDWSPAFHLSFEHPHTGENIGPTLLELTSCSSAYQINLRPPAETNPGVMLAADTDTIHAPPTKETPVENEETPFDAEGAISALAAELAQLSSVVAAMAEGAVEGEEEEEAPVAMSADTTELLSRIADLEEGNIRLELAAVGITSHTDDFVRLALADRAAFEFAVSQAKPTNPLHQVELGNTGVQTTGTESLTAADVLALATTAGKNRTGMLRMYCITNGHADLADAVVNLSRQEA